MSSPLLLLVCPSNVPARLVQVLAARSMHFGLWVTVACVICFAARHGRLADIASTCSQAGSLLRSAPGGPSWRGLFTTGGWGWSWLMPRTLGGGWPLLERLACYTREAGLFAAGMGALWYLVLPALVRSAAPPLQDSWVLDLGLGFGVVGAVAGCYVVGCLGGSWLTWLMCWQAWVLTGMSLCWRQPMPLLPHQAGYVLVVAVVMPLAAGALPFVHLSAYLPRASL